MINLCFVILLLLQWRMMNGSISRSVVKILLPAWSRLTDTHQAGGGLTPRQMMFRKQKTYCYVDMLIKCSKIKRSS